ncbi:MAG: transketolase [Holosporaceae bacterium]|jgi:transketolase|nr:transketolase [Holosporaceae bacterium]
MFRSLANAVRFLSIHEVGVANSGHLGMALGMADCLTVLFRNFLRFYPHDPRWPNRDRLVFSGGHGSPALYALLHLSGYKKMTLDELKRFRQLGSIAAGHPEYDLDCGIEVSTGLLGQGFANAVGMAIEERLLNARFGDECINHYIYVCAGDGDFMEGITHEASAIAGRLALGHLIVLFDDNGITIDGKVNVSTSENTLQRYESYGWHVLSVDGHSEDDIHLAIAMAQSDPRPSLLACKTQIGFGTPRAGTPKAHSGALSSQEIEETKKNLQWLYGPFEIPEYIAKVWQATGLRHQESYEKWIKTQAERFGAREFEYTEHLKKTLRNIKKEYFVSRPFAATRINSQDILSRLTAETNLIISGSCDLGSSTGCLTKSMIPLEKTDFSGNYIHYGVREQAMGAIMNGIVAGRKIIAIGGTFLAFSDYMRADIRMAALMNIPSIFVFSHDSIGVGEDGPTHQPVEQIAALRSIPNLNVFRPADAQETVECWECALTSSNPSAIILTRQNVLSVRFSGKENLCENGAYLLYEDNMDVYKRVTLIASGSEVGIALDVKKMLNDNSVSANVVSIPCWRLFDKQPENYRRQVLGNDLRIGIEASSGFGWEKYLGTNGLFFGVNDFGKSAPCADVYEYFGLTAHKIYCQVMEKIN